jgi:hypothetical protein
LWCSRFVPAERIEPGLGTPQCVRGWLHAALHDCPGLPAAERRSSLDITPAARDAMSWWITLAALKSANSWSGAACTRH